MSDETFKLRPISDAAVDKAMRLAERYRLLNEAWQAESICRDVLRVRPDDQEALVMIILALTDQFAREDYASGGQAARDYAAKLTDAYQAAYYSGLIAERQARARLGRAMAGSFAYNGLREAMDWYEKAEALRPPNNDDPILRWNSCVRTIRRAGLRPPVSENELPLE